MSTAALPSQIVRVPLIIRIPFIKRIPVIVRKRVNQNMIAHWYGQNADNEVTRNVDLAPFLYESVKKWVFLNVHRHAASRYSTVEDMAQECWQRLISKLHLYDSSKSQFTTWVGRVCVNMMNSACRKQIKSVGVIVPMEDGMDAHVQPVDNSLSKELCEAVTDLAEQHPRKKKLLKAIFGEWTDMMTSVPTDIDFRAIAKVVKQDVQEVRHFIGTVVRPFLRSRFATDND